jgi:hypothetical protein
MNLSGVKILSAKDALYFPSHLSVKTGIHGTTHHAVLLVVVWLCLFNTASTILGYSVNLCCLTVCVHN